MAGSGGDATGARAGRDSARGGSAASAGRWKAADAGRRPRKRTLKKQEKARAILDMSGELLDDPARDLKSRRNTGGSAGPKGPRAGLGGRIAPMAPRCVRTREPGCGETPCEGDGICQPPSVPRPRTGARSLGIRPRGTWPRRCRRPGGDGHHDADAGRTQCATSEHPGQTDDRGGHHRLALGHRPAGGDLIARP